MNRRRIGAFVALWVCVTGGALVAPGCYGRNCEGDFEVYGIDGGQGRMLSDDTWESSPVLGEWLWYPRQRIYIFEIPALGGRKPWNFVPYVSAVPNPNVVGDNQVVGAGNIALISGVGPNRIRVKNDTCSDFYLRLVVEVEPFAPETNQDVVDASVADAIPSPTEEALDAGDGGD